MKSAKGRWAEELPKVSWAYQTTLKRSTGETHFSMIYKTEAMLLVEIGLPSMKTTSFTPNKNELLMAEQLDLAEENKEMMSVQLTEY